MSGRPTTDREAVWARAMVAKGHHHRCATHSGGACNCYYDRGEYRAARLLLTLREELAAEREHADRLAAGLEHSRMHGDRFCAYDDCAECAEIVAALAAHRERR